MSYTHLLGHLIQSHGFKHFPYADVSTTCISSNDLSPHQLYCHISNWLPDTQLGFLAGISNLTVPKRMDAQFLYPNPDSFPQGPPFCGHPAKGSGFLPLVLHSLSCHSPFATMGLASKIPCSVLPLHSTLTDSTWVQATINMNWTRNTAPCFLPLSLLNLFSAQCGSLVFK